MDYLTGLGYTVDDATLLVLTHMPKIKADKEKHPTRKELNTMRLEGVIDKAEWVHAYYDLGFRDKWVSRFEQLYDALNTTDDVDEKE